MGGYIDVVKKSKQPHVQSLKDDIIARRNKDFFWPNGTQVYTGSQGSGKTISLVKHLLDLKDRYPKAIIVSNLDLKYFEGQKCTTDTQILDFLRNADFSKQYIRFDTIEELSLLLVKVNNGFYGVIYVIDEIHTYFNALESKNVPMYVFTEISQQRKQRKLILGTSQLFMRMAKALREQCDNVIVCRTILGFFTITKAWDGMSLEQDYNGNLTGKLKKTGWYWHNRKLRNAFDTFQKVVSGSDQFEATQRIEIHKNGKKIAITGS